MSGATLPKPSIKQQLHRDQRRARIVALAAVAVLAALLVALVLALGGGDAHTADTLESAVGATQQPSAAQLPAHPSPESVPPSPQPGIRYDGGPEEGSRGTSSDLAPNPGRPDGGPEEGTRGPGR
jgi:hypothetical protein